MSSDLFTPFQIKNVEFKNRIGMSPMCQYSSTDGVASDWHMVHLGARAVGGVGFIMAECTAVSATGRISQGCAGLWNEDQVAALKPIVALQRQFGAVTGIQISHSGRKGSAATALEGGSHLDANDPNGWETVGPTADAFDPDGTRLWKAPRALSIAEIHEIQGQFVRSAELALEVGYDLLEVHCAHGYLLHSFLTPLVNTRTDDYGGDLRARARFLLETVEKVRAVWPQDRVLSVRLSVHDFAAGGLTLDDTSQVGLWLKELGVDILDCSGGGAVPEARGAIGNRTAEQPEMAGQLRKATGLPVMAVGGITDPKQADALVANSCADIVLLGREMMRDPHWAFNAAKELGIDARHVLAEQYGFFVGAS
ncbi:NADH:flavin oxidoreductase/NADH oxidase [uncultured Sulfitobacter sp.]|uniref:NADH:flavin oxidoreductase/NADH oxidase n=1 Tax=uncultured Sulfitobacter sp. TaxID=191468 RepID=UPI002639FBB7|nr:NADH:flavin oxidoreductase/NADH oxidase [uncultured Sulfitobacter sp.]